MSSSTYCSGHRTWDTWKDQEWQIQLESIDSSQAWPCEYQSDTRFNETFLDVTTTKFIHFRRFSIVLPKTALLNNLNKSIPALSPLRVSSNTIAQITPVDESFWFSYRDLHLKISLVYYVLINDMERDSQHSHESIENTFAEKVRAYHHWPEHALVIKDIDYVYLAVPWGIPNPLRGYIRVDYLLERSKYQSH